MSIREKLGLSPKKAEPNVTHLPKDYFDEHREEVAKKLEAAEGDEDAPDKEETIAAMEDAADKLEKLTLHEGSWGLIDRALDSMSRNTGAGLTDEDAKTAAKQRAALAKAADNDLSVMVQAIAQATPVMERGGAVYSLLYRVLSQCLFFANLDFRQAEGMDAFSDEAGVQEFFTRYVNSSYVDEALARVVQDTNGDVMLSADDEREAEQEGQMRSEQGFEARRDAELRFLKEKYGSDEPAEAVVQALEDVRLFFQLTAEVYGWDPAQTMGYAYVQNPNGTFTAITDARTAIDAQEIKREAAKKKRREARAAQMDAAQAAAEAIIAKALERPRNHLRK